MGEQTKLKPCVFCGREFEIRLYEDEPVSIVHPFTDGECPLCEYQVWPESLDDEIRKLNHRPIEVTHKALMREAAKMAFRFRALSRAADDSGAILTVKGTRSFGEDVDHCTDLIQRLEEAGKE